MSIAAVILDTNVFVAAGFNGRSASARILKRVRSGEARIVWTRQTRREIQFVLEKIPRLSWDRVASLFCEANRYNGPLTQHDFDYIADPDDRKFAALAAAARVPLITNDSHLLDHREQCRDQVEILTPAEYVQRDDG